MDRTFPNKAFPQPNVKLRDSAFTLLFRHPDRVYDLYRSLCPQDLHVRPQDIEISTLELLWVRGFYNDLSFSVGDRLCVLTEAQTRWCPNMPARMLIYYAELLKKYLRKKNMELTSGSLQPLPAPQFFVIYTGSGHEDCQRQELASAFRAQAHLQAQVQIVRTGPRGSILAQYIAFCQLYREQKKRFDNPKDIIQNTIKICREKGILVEFLSAHTTEVEEVMEQMFNQEKIFERLRQEDRQEGLQKGLAIALERLMKSSGYSLDKAMAMLALPTKDRPRYEKLLGIH